MIKFRIKKKNALILAMAALSMAASILLMILLEGVRMAFAPGPGQTSYQSYSYFDLMPLGYGNWLPMITAVTACLSLVLILITLVRGTTISPKKTSMILSAISLIANLISFIMFSSMNVASVLIITLIAISTVLQYAYYRKTTVE